MCNGEKEYINKSKSKWDISSWKINCFFDIITVLKEDNWTDQVQDRVHNHNSTLARAYLFYGKIVCKREFQIKLPIMPKLIHLHDKCWLIFVLIKAQKTFYSKIWIFIMRHNKHVNTS